MDKQSSLRTAKRNALLLLLAAAALFVASAFAPPSLLAGCVKATAEAAMVGAMADWFAVVALFRRVPIPLVSRHTAIIPNNKDRIGDNLAAFVQDKFLDPASLAALIRRHDPAARITGWLQSPGNAHLLGGYAVRIAGGLLGVIDDARVQRFIVQGFHALLDKVDVSRSMGAVLDTLTQDGRHQQLLDAGIEKLVELLRRPESREFIARRIVEWLRSEPPLKELILPTEWLGEHGAEMLANALDKMLLQVAQDPQHELRRGFDEAVRRMVERLRADPEFIAKGEAFKAYLRHGEAARQYLGGLWAQWRDWIRADLARSDSRLHARVTAMGQWIGRELAASDELRRSLNEHLEDAARTMAPDFAAFLTHHISDTVRHWDAQEMSRQIELNIGKDLQYVRINGTLVGGSIGLALFWAAWLIDRLR